MLWKQVEREPAFLSNAAMLGNSPGFARSTETEVCENRVVLVIVEISTQHEFKLWRPVTLIHGFIIHSFVCWKAPGRHIRLASLRDHLTNPSQEAIPLDLLSLGVFLLSGPSRRIGSCVEGSEQGGLVDPLLTL